MKTIIQIVLIIVMVVLGFFIYDSIMEPVRFQREAAHREDIVIQRLKDIREVQVAFRGRHGRFNSNIDSLIQFVNSDSLPVIRAIGSVPDNLTEAEALEQGLIQRDTIWVLAKDSLLTEIPYPLDSLPYIPFSQGSRFKMDASKIERGLVKIPVFEAIALPEEYMKGVDNWKIYYTRELEVGLRVGSLFEASIDGNWE